MNRRDIEHFAGCMLGGAVGDALGAPVEFLSLDEIRRRFGPDGVTGVENVLDAGEGDDVWLPLYEAKMIWHFDHRFATYERATQAEINAGRLPKTTPEQKADPSFVAIPRYWVFEKDINKHIPKTWQHKWFIGFRDITSAVVERTSIFSLLPNAAIGNSIPLILLDPQNSIAVACLYCSMNCLTLDYIARQKISGTHMNFFFVQQFPVLAPANYNAPEHSFIIPRASELVYTSREMKPFADDIWRDAGDDLRDTIRQQWNENETATGGHELNPPDWAEITDDGIHLPPFKWDEDRRALIRAELDAYYAKLYGLTEEELYYILDPSDVYGPDFPGETFRVLKNKEINQYGEYRTKRLVLQAFEQLGTGDASTED